jgi:membrane protease YdiL (CAAX protease family)
MPATPDEATFEALMNTTDSAKSRAAISLIDIVIFFAAGFGLQVLFNAVVPFPADPRAPLVFEALSKLPVLVVIWLILRAHGETPAAIGLRSTITFSRALSLGAAVGAGIFVIVFFLERLGFHRDLSAFDFLKGNLELTIYESIYVVIAAGFYEEVYFRGFLFHRLATLFGGNRIAWAAASLVQAVAFGYAHAYQGPNGMLLTGAIGLLLAILFLKCGRNLWPPIIAHAFYDVARTIMFYFTGPPA